ncbi:MAG: cation:proton antiporter [Alphaproteobacteria bacterium]|nr:cation:proton antiporter [Alphaproteobacteria bacterium]
MSTPGDLTFYKETLIVLTTAGVVVPVMHRLRISPVIGYLTMGALVGPRGLGQLVDEVPLLRSLTISGDTDLPGIAELGIVFLMFVIGLELSVQRLITMRRLVFGLGGLQVLSASLVLGGAALLLGLSAPAAVLTGSSLALSSTAVVLRLLAERGRLATSMGRASFAVLLFQDLTVVPILFLVSMLAPQNQGSLLLGLATALGAAALTLGGIVTVGRLVLRPLFRLVAGTQSPELFVAATMLVAIGAGVLAAASGLSMALGAFVAGLLLAETEYHKAVEATVEPFNGLLLGVFFIAVGMRIDVPGLLARPGEILSLAGGLIAIKIVLILPLARRFALAWPAAIEMALLLGPGGEFAFVVIGLAVSLGIVPGPEGALLLGVIALSMATIPPLGAIGRFLSRRLGQAGDGAPELMGPPPADISAQAIIVGGGRVGHLVSELLAVHGISYVVTDRDAHAVARLRGQGKAAYFGDAKNPLFLKHCGYEQARTLIITISDHPEIDEIVAVARRLRADVPIIARARDARHAEKLYKAGVTDAVPETIEASLQLSEASLVALGIAMGPAIASIHEKRDEFRRQLRAAVGERAAPVRGLRASAPKPQD